MHSGSKERRSYLAPLSAADDARCSGRRFALPGIARAAARQSRRMRVRAGTTGCTCQLRAQASLARLCRCPGRFSAPDPIHPPSCPFGRLRVLGFVVNPSCPSLPPSLSGNSWPLPRPYSILHSHFCILHFLCPRTERPCGRTIYPRPLCLYPRMPNCWTRRRRRSCASMIGTVNLRGGAKKRHPQSYDAIQ